jgi:hypothetical protein
MCTNLCMGLSGIICIVISCSQFQQMSPATHESYLVIPVIQRLQCSVVTTLHTVYRADLQTVTCPHRNHSENLIIKSRFFISNSYSLVIFTDRISLGTLCDISCLCVTSLYSAFGKSLCT